MAEHEIYESIEHKVKLKIRTIFVSKKIIEEYSVKIYETDHYFSKIMKKKFKLIVITKNIYYLELMFTLLNIV